MSFPPYPGKATEFSEALISQTPGVTGSVKLPAASEKPIVTDPCCDCAKSWMPPIPLDVTASITAPEIVSEAGTSVTDCVVVIPAASETCGADANCTT